MAFLGTFAAMGKSTSRRSAKYSYGKLLALLPKVGRVRRREISLAPGREPPYFSGAFFIFAQVRGN